MKIGIGSNFVELFLTKISIVAKVQHAADFDTLYIYPYTLDGGVQSADGRNQRHVVLFETINRNS